MASRSFGDGRKAIPLPFGWLLVTRSYLRQFSKNAFEEGKKAGAVDTSDIIAGGEQLATDLKNALRRIEIYKQEASRMAEMIDKTQKDAYEMGREHGRREAEDEPD